MSKAMCRKGIIFGVLAALLLLAQAGRVAGSWLIDERKFHISAHGQIACLDCHEAEAEKQSHPNPVLVNKRRSDFFSPDQCLACHDSVTDDLDRGFHGHKKVADRGKYEKCIRCHRPHYQRRLGENRLGEFKPAEPRQEQCAACHENRKALPPLSSEDEACMTCHRLPDVKDTEAAGKTKKFCFYCHGERGPVAREMGGQKAPLIDEEAYRATSHSAIACTVCHPESARFLHGDQEPGECSPCHLPHDEKTAHDAHRLVACAACHLEGIHPTRDPKTKRILWEWTEKGAAPSTIHHMIHEDDESACRRCHFKGNRVGAASVVLPAKSVICMPCHAATFSIGDTTTVISLILFFGGLLATFSYWVTGAMGGPGDRGPIGRIFRMIGNALGVLFSRKILAIIKAVVLDVLFQRRLYRHSRIRWFIHGLIFYPFVFRFTWGIIALVGSLWLPERGFAWAMLDKNHWAAGFLFDFTGVMVIVGIAMALVRGVLADHERLSGLPKQDRRALFLIASIVIVGFVLEGLRIATTGRPEGAGYAFVGYVISVLFSENPFWNQVYGYVWYIHAILTGLFFAYLPFSQLIHIITAPAALAVNSVSENESGRG